MPIYAGLRSFIAIAFVLTAVQNLGATCYANTLLQALFLNPPFRKGIYDCHGTEVQSSSGIVELNDYVECYCAAAAVIWTSAAEQEVCCES